MDNSKRIETVARALARFRLGKEPFVSSLNPDLVGKLRQSAEDKLWPSLVGEAAAAIEAIDASGQDANGRILEVQQAAATPPEVAPVSGSGTVDKEGTVRIDRAPTTSAPSADLSDPLPGSTRPLRDPQPAALAADPNTPLDAASEGLRTALAALIATGRSRFTS